MRQLCAGGVGYLKYLNTETSFQSTSSLTILQGE